MKNKTKFLSIVLFAALLLAGCSPAVSLGGFPLLSQAPILAQAQQTATPAADTQVAQVPINAGDNTTLADFQSTLEQVYERVNPSVVNIQVEVGGSESGTSPSTENSPFGQDQAPQGGVGSGFVWDSQGHIVTNNHVVENASRVIVTFADGSTVEAKVVGTDPDSDLAVIQVDASAVQLTPVALVDSSQVKVGQVAIAIGNPYGLSGTMTQGIVSALERSLPVSANSSNSFSSSSGTYTIPDIIQTDAAINPGNSGGVLVNADGKVIGVTAAITSSSNSNSGIGFVIPANIVSRVVPELIKTGHYDHPRIGMSGTTLTLDLASALSLPSDQKGVLVIDVLEGSPAAKAGLEGSGSQAGADGLPTSGDVITAIDGTVVKTFEDLTSYLFSNTQVGQTVTLTIVREGREQTVKLTLGVLSSTSQQ